MSLNPFLSRYTTNQVPDYEALINTFSPLPFLKSLDHVFNPSNLLAKNVPVDLIENDAGVVVKIELPGVEKKDVKLQVEEKGNTKYLTVKAVKTETLPNPVVGTSETVTSTTSTVNGVTTSSVDTTKRYREQYYGKIERTILLPNTADLDQVTTSFLNGILYVSFKTVNRNSNGSREIQL